MFEQLGDLGTRLRIVYFEARLLDGLGRARESEKLFRDAIKAYFEHELYKEAFITLLSLFESFCRRGALPKAAALCEAAIEATDQAGEACNEQICLVWKELLATVRVRQLSEGELIAARQYLVRNWSVARAGAFVLPGVETAPASAPQQFAPPPPPEGVPEGLSIPEALADYERKLLESALQQTGGNLRVASRLVGLSRNALKNKIRRFGL